MKTALIFFVFLPWKTLNWNDFKMKPPVPASQMAARSNITIQWEYESANDDPGERVISFKAVPFFNPDSSFVNERTDYILKHEQGHMDICRIVCEEANRDVSHNKEISAKQFQEIQKYYEQEWKKIDDDYDKQTSHSMNHVSQERWNQWIAEQIKK